MAWPRGGRPQVRCLAAPRLACLAEDCHAGRRAWGGQSRLGLGVGLRGRPRVRLRLPPREGCKA
eukprot:3118777-Alexandrium_andersonii.AAC.1